MSGISPTSPGAAPWVHEIRVRQKEARVAFLTADRRALTQRLASRRRGWCRWVPFSARQTLALEEFPSLAGEKAAGLTD